MNAATIRVVIVDDHTLMRQGLVGLLADEVGIDVVGEAGDAGAAREIIAAEEPDVVLMDVGLPGTSGLELTAELTAVERGPRVLIVTMHDRDDYLLGALKAGASGYVLKGAEVGELVEAVRTVALGETFVSRSLTGSLVAGFLSAADGGMTTGPAGGLTDRELEVLVLIADGLTTAEIAERLYLSVHTVQTHRDHIMTKLDLHSVVELTKYAIKQGFIDLEA